RKRDRLDFFHDRTLNFGRPDRPFNLPFEILDGSQLRLILFLQHGWKARRAKDRLILFYDSIEKIFLACIRTVTGWLLAADSEVEFFYLDGVSADPEIIKACAQESHFGDVPLLLRVFGRNLRHYSISCHDFKNIQTFDDGGGQS